MNKRQVSKILQREGACRTGQKWFDRQKSLKSAVLGCRNSRYLDWMLHSACLLGTKQFGVLKETSYQQLRAIDYHASVTYQINRRRRINTEYYNGVRKLIYEVLRDL